MLGYPVHATSGVGGGYQLGAGTRLPPLLLDDEEAIATAVSLRLASGGTVAGAVEAALRVLAKLDQVMPPRLREEVRAVHGATDTLFGPGVEIDPELLVTLARACRDGVRVRFAYPRRGGEGLAGRAVEPVRMVATGRRWYLMAWDVERDDWRTFRLDRAHARPDQVRALVPPQVGLVEDDRDGWCLLVTGGDDLDWLAVHVARLGFEAKVLEPAELRDATGRLAHRLAAMAGPGAPALTHSTAREA